MRNLISAAWLRVRKNKVFWGAMALMVFFAVNSRLNQYIQRKNYDVEVTLDTSFFDFVLFASIFMSVFVSLFLGTEYGEGTIRNKLVVGHKRRNIYGTNLLVCMMVNLLLTAAYLIPSIAVGVPLIGSFQSESGAILMLFGCGVLSLMAYTAVYTAVAMVCQSRAVTAVICVLGAFLLMTAGIYIHSKLEQPEYYSPYRISMSEDGVVVDENQVEEPNPLIGISSRDPSMRRLADAINMQLRRLRSLRHRYQQGDLELKEAITGISHDIRTPLTAILGYLELLKQEELPPETARCLSIIQERAQVIRQLTEELFRYSALSLGEYEGPAASLGSREEVSLQDALEESLLAYYGALRSAKIEPVISMPKKKVLRNLNKKGLSRIFGNLISNAMKYSAGDLFVSLEETGRITFRNSAPRLNEVEAASLFGRFYTVEDAKNSTGLGLSIAKSLVTQMGGTVTAEYQNQMLHIHVLFPEDRKEET